MAVHLASRFRKRTFRKRCREDVPVNRLDQVHERRGTESKFYPESSKAEPWVLPFQSSSGMKTWIHLLMMRSKIFSDQDRLTIRIRRNMAFETIGAAEGLRREKP